MSDFHTVAKGDTLIKIAKAHGTSVAELKKLNQLENPNRLGIGQRIALKKEAVFGFQALFLDRNRDPIQGLEYALEFAGRIVKGVTPINGLGRTIVTERAEDEVKILVKRLDDTWKEVGKTISGYGNKLVTILSQAVRIDSSTDKHPDLADGEKPNPRESAQPKFDPKEKPPPSANKKPGLEKEKAKSTDGKPKEVVSGDIPDLSFLEEYVGVEVTRADIEAAADKLKCDPGLIYAIAKQESSKSSFIKLGGVTVPTILYERHKFEYYSGGRFSSQYADISGPPYHHVKKIKAAVSKGKQRWKIVDKKTGEASKDDDIYGATGLRQYKRLSKAYQLDKAAALKACSWGKYQIMGFNFGAAGFDNVFDFVKAMSRGDAEHLKAFLSFANYNKILLDGLRTKNFDKIAEGHNGENWKAINQSYAANIEKYYREY